MNQKHLLLVIALIFALAAGWFVLDRPAVAPPTPPIETPTDEANKLIESIRDLIDEEYLAIREIDPFWKEIKNQDAGYTIRIPNNWYANAENDGMCLKESGKNYVVEGSQNQCAIYISGAKDAEILKGGKFREIIKRIKTNYNAKIYSLSVDNKPAIIQKGFGIETYIFNGDKYYVVSFSLDSALYGEVVEVYPNILGSFRFLK